MKRNLRRYHYKLYLPENIGEMLLEFYGAVPFVDVTNHGAAELEKDKRGLIPLPSKEEMFSDENKLVEVYECLDENNNPTGVAQKIVVRIPYLSEKFDYTYVLAREGFIVSAWAIDKDDNHRLTESLNKYFIPEDRRQSILKKIKREQKNYVKKSKNSNDGHRQFN